MIVCCNKFIVLFVTKCPVFYIKNFLTFFLTIKLIICIFEKKIMTKEKIEELIKIGATRKCNKCNEVLSVTDFHIKVDKNNKHCRFNSPCKSCANIGRNINYQKLYQRKIKYNLSNEEYNLILKEQSYSCAICNIHQDDYHKEFSVDHCHKTGKVRALLCNQCNSGIGFFRESTSIMKKAIDYIKKHKTK